MKKKQTLLKEWNWWNSVSDRNKQLISLAFLLILPIFLTPETIFGDLKFMANDIVQWRGGAESIIQARKALGVEPIWAANMYGGMPAYFISYKLSVLNIDTLINTVFQGIFPAATFWVGLIGYFFLFRELNRSYFASLLGSISIVFTTYVPVIIGAGHNSKFYAMNYIPWVFLGFFMILLQKRNKWLALGLFAFALSLELRAGHPQVTYYYGFVMGIIWLFDLIKQIREKQISSLISKNALFLVAVLITLSSVVQPYWSKTEFTPYSTRGGSVTNESSGLAFDYAMAWSQGWGELLTLVVPNIYGGSSSIAYWGPKSFTSGPHYAGAIIILFFLIGLIYYKGRWKWPLITSILLTAFFSLGNNFSLLNEFMFNYFPYFSKFRTPEMWLIATVFSLSFIAVFALDELKTHLITDNKWLYAAGGVIGFGLLIALASGTILSFEKQGEREQIAQQIAQSNNVSVSDPRVNQSVSRVIEQQLLPDRKAAAQKDAWRLVILVGIITALLYAVKTNRLSLEMASLFVVLVASFDMIQIGGRFIPAYSKVPNSYNIEAKVQQALNKADYFVKENNMDSTGVWPYRAFPIASNPYANAAPSFYYPSIGGYTAVKIGAFQDFINEALNDNSTGLPRNSMLSMLNVKFLPIPQRAQLDGFKIAYSEDNNTVLELEEVLPKAWFVDEIKKVTNSKDALNEIKKSTFDPKKTAIVESNLELSIESKQDSSTIAVTTYNEREIVLNVSASKNEFLVLSEVYYPKGWKAFINDQETEIFKTNFILRGIQVPKGNHAIRFTFNPTSHELGSKISWAGTSIIWIIFGFGLFNQFFRKEED